MRRRTKEELDARDEAIRREFHRSYSAGGIVGLHGALSDDVYGERRYEKPVVYMPVPERQRR